MTVCVISKINLFSVGWIVRLFHSQAKEFLSSRHVKGNTKNFTLGFAYALRGDNLNYQIVAKEYF